VPGVIVHELGHLLLCRLSGVRVHQAVLFRLGSPAGFVSHSPPRLLRQHVAISAGPLAVSTLLATALFTLVARFILTRPEPWWPVGALVALWLGWSIALEAWPSGADAAALGRSARAQLQRLNPGAMVVLPLAWALTGVSASRRVRGHWLYAAGLAAMGSQLASW
jgi:hypothetical protein